MEDATPAQEHAPEAVASPNPEFGKSEDEISPPVAPVDSHPASPPSGEVSEGNTDDAPVPVADISEELPGTTRDPNGDDLAQPDVSTDLEPPIESEIPSVSQPIDQSVPEQRHPSSGPHVPSVLPRLRRLQKRQRIGSDSDSSDSDDDEPIALISSTAPAAVDIEIDTTEPSAPRPSTPTPVMRSGADDDAFGDIPLSSEDESDIEEETWLLRDGESVDEARERVRSRRQKRRRFAERGTDPELAAAMKIFGVSDPEMLTMMRDEPIPTTQAPDIGIEAVTGQRRDISDSLALYKKVYEPSVLDEKFITELDQTIATVDAPERMQLAARALGQEDITEFQPNEKEIDQEARWIYENEFAFQDQKNFGHELLADRMNLRIESLRQIINAYRVDLLEPPFVAQYRREFVEEIFEYGDLWVIQEWDEKWRHYFRRLRKLADIMAAVDENSDYEWDNYKKCHCDIDLNDLYEHASHIYRETDAIASARLPGADRSTALMKGSNELFAAYGITSQQIGENFEAHLKLDLIEDTEDTPEDLAIKIAGDTGTEAHVLQATRKTFAMDIATDPLVRRCVRQLVQKLSVINTSPTPDLGREIDPFHRYGPIKRIKDKPVMKMDGIQYLEMLKGKKEGLLTVDVSIPKSGIEELISQLAKLMQSDGTSATSEMWNDERRYVLSMALNDHLLPILMKETEKKLEDDAVKICVKMCSEALKGIVFAGGAPSIDGNFKRATVMGIAWPDSNQEACFVSVIGRDGNPIAQLKLASIGLGGGPLVRRADDYRASTNQPRDADVETLYKFIKNHQPEYIAVGTNTLQSRRCHECVMAFVTDRGFGDGNDETYVPNVIYFTEQLARVYEHCKQAVEEFSDFAPALRRAIGLGRHVQDPIHLAAALCRDGADVLASALDLHACQDMCTPASLMRGLTNVMTDCINSVGVDLGRVASSAPTSHIRGVVQFLAGMGPRKATRLLRVLSRRGGIIPSRSFLRKLMGPVVFTNLAGFVYIPRTDDLDAAYIDPSDRNSCDATRIHPDDYNLALKIAIDALDTPTDDAIEGCIDKVMSDAKVLDDIDVHAFAEVLEAQGKGNKLPSLQTIVEELKHPYAERRPPFSEPEGDELFTLLTGESDESLQTGQIVHARITRVAPPSRIYCRLEESGLTGYIQVDHFSDSLQLEEVMQFANGRQPIQWSPDDVLNELRGMGVPDELLGGFAAHQLSGAALLDITFEELHKQYGLQKELAESIMAHVSVFRRNQSIYSSVGMLQGCRVISVEKEKAIVHLTSCKAHLLGSRENAEKAAIDKRDPYYDTSIQDDVQAEQLLQAKRRAKARRLAGQRVIAHPQFKSMNSDEAEEYLEDRDVGDAVIRPSHRNPNHLIISWKFHDSPSIITHLDIEEIEKKSNLSVGAKLKLVHNDIIYDDLDEILARFVDPTSMYAHDMALHEKFNSGSQDEIEEKLRDMKRQNPKSIPYLVGLTYRYPGNFTLSYLPGSVTGNIRHELVSVEPHGYLLRGQVFTTPGRMINWFKVHWKEPLPAVGTLTRKTPRPNTPLRTPSAMHAAAQASEQGYFNLPAPPRPSIPVTTAPTYDYPPTHSYPPPIPVQAAAAGYRGPADYHGQGVPQGQTGYQDQAGYQAQPGYEGQQGQPGYQYEGAQPAYTEQYDTAAIPGLGTMQWGAGAWQPNERSEWEED